MEEKKKLGRNHITIDTILLMMYQVHQDLRDVFPVQADINYEA